MHYLYGKLREKKCIDFITVAVSNWISVPVATYANTKTDTLVCSKDTFSLDITWFVLALPMLLSFRELELSHIIFSAFMK